MKNQQIPDLFMKKLYYFVMFVVIFGGLLVFAASKQAKEEGDLLKGLTPTEQASLIKTTRLFEQVQGGSMVVVGENDTYLVVDRGNYGKFLVGPGPRSNPKRTDIPFTKTMKFVKEMEISKVLKDWESEHKLTFDWYKSN